MSQENHLEAQSTQDTELTEEAALQIALKRTRLEEAAANPTSGSWHKWGLWLLGISIFLSLQGRLVESINILFIILFLFIHIHWKVARVHSRIDALLELDRSLPASKRQLQQVHTEATEGSKDNTMPNL